MKKNTPLLIFTGLAVAAAATLGAVLTGNIPGAIAPQPVAEAPGFAGRTAQQRPDPDPDLAR